MKLHRWAVAAAACLFTVAPTSIFAAQPRSDSSQHATAVYVATNAASGNAIVAYRATTNGQLALLGTYPTGGLGVGPNAVPSLAPAAVDPLGSQGSVAVDARTLLVVNAASGTITTFAIRSDDTLKSVSVVASGGIFPTAIAALGRLVYVANAGNPAANIPATVSGFTLAANGTLTAIPNSTRSLSQPTASVAASIVLSPDGRFLVAADKVGDRITTFAVQPNGGLAAPVSTPSVGAGPFAAIFHGGALLVAETESGVAGATTVSSYQLRANGTVSPISAAIPDGETAGCWLAARAASPLVFDADAASGTISSYVQGYRGALTLGVGIAAPVIPMSGAVDLGVSADAHYVYQLYDAIGEVGEYAVEANGTLSAIGVISSGLPTTGAQGLAVY